MFLPYYINWQQPESASLIRENGSKHTKETIRPERIIPRKLQSKENENVLQGNFKAKD